jgi:c-di-GMP-binding flagellar brake protein YcgR
MHASSDFEDVVQSGSAFRRHERQYFASTVQVLTPQRRILEAQTLDISLGGLKLVLPASLPVGTACGVRLVIPVVPYSARVIVAEAKITSIVLSGREGGFLAGLRFTAVPEDSLRMLHNYLQERHAHRTHRSRLQRQRREGTAAGSPALA